MILTLNKYLRTNYLISLFKGNNIVVQLITVVLKKKNSVSAAQVASHLCQLYSKINCYIIITYNNY